MTGARVSRSSPTSRPPDARADGSRTFVHRPGGAGRSLAHRPQPLIRRRPPWPLRRRLTRLRRRGRRPDAASGGVRGVVAGTRLGAFGCEHPADEDRDAPRLAPQTRPSPRSPGVGSVSFWRAIAFTGIKAHRCAVGANAAPERHCRDKPDRRLAMSPAPGFSTRAGAQSRRPSPVASELQGVLPRRREKSTARLPDF